MEHSSSKLKHDVFTVPNAITVGRLALSPIVAYRLAKNPAKRWPEAMLFALSDNVDGALARLGDKHPQLHRLGFRCSEIGRKADPFVDKIFTGEMLLSGTAGGVLKSKTARTLVAASLAQKTTVGLQTWHNERDGIELNVRRSGKYFEFLNNLGFGMQFIAENMRDTDHRQQVQRVGLGLAAIGIAGALMNNVRYRLEADQQRQANPLITGQNDHIDQPRLVAEG